jgi:hypothetical protein
VTKLGGGKGGGTKKFICSHCHKTYLGSYICVRKNFCGIIPWDEGRNIVVKIYDHVPIKYRNK